MEEGPLQEVGLSKEVVAYVDPVWAKTTNIANTNVVSALAVEVAEASPEVCAQNSMLRMSQLFVVCQLMKNMLY